MKKHAAKYYEFFFTALLLYGVQVNTFSQVQDDKSALLKGIYGLPLNADSIPAIVTYPIAYEPEIIASGNISEDSLHPNYAPIIVSAKMGKGKILVIGNNLFLKKPFIEEPNVLLFWKNVLKWATKSGTSIAFEGESFENVISIASALNLHSRHLEKNTVPSTKTALFLNRFSNDSNYLEKIEDFIRKGGIVVYVSSMWDDYKNAGNNLVDIPVNKLLNKAGLFHFGDLIMDGPFIKMYTGVTPDYLSPNSIIPNISNYQYIPKFYDKGNYRAPLTILKLIYFFSDSATQIRRDLINAISAPQFDSLGFPSLKKPLETGYWPDLFRLILRVDEDEHKYERDHRYRATTNKEFPGVVSDNTPRMTKEVEINYSNKWNGLEEVDTSFKRWHSTGLYVAPGDVVQIILRNVRDTCRHVVAQIGVHEDDVTNANTYYRNPVNLVKTFDLNKDTVSIHSLYGGLLYLNVPVMDQDSSFKAKVIGAVNAPYFKLGKNTNAEWVSAIRSYPAPWAELATDKIILTVPSDSIRNLNDPEKLMRLWDEVMDANAELAIIPKERTHAERIIIDNNVKWGYMYTVPSKIVAPNDHSLSVLLNERSLRDTGSWGHFHELGHRHQFSNVDFQELTEVTVNLYTLYVYEKIVGKNIYEARDGISRDSVRKVIHTYISNPEYDVWKADPFLQLYTLYYPILDAFGWDAIKKLNTASRRIYNDQYGGVDMNVLYKKGNDKIRDEYFVLLSKALEKNLGDYFDKLKIPISDEAKKEVSDLPLWIPDVFK